tara:strand:- start:300 stop:566 length:267 start_codon:yes stop_codon:yes gene_type:complete
MIYLGKVNIFLKEGINDPQGLSVLNAAHNLGFQQVSEVRVGKYLELTVSAKSPDEAQNLMDSLCTSILTNPLIESYNTEIEQVTQRNP